MTETRNGNAGTVTARVIAVIGDRLREQGRNWSDLAKEMGLSDSRFTKWKQGIGELSIARLIEFSNSSLDLTVEQLLGLEPPPPALDEEERLLCNFVFGGPNPIGLERALHLLRIGLEAERSESGPGRPIAPAGPGRVAKKKRGR